MVSSLIFKDYILFDIGNVRYICWPETAIRSCLEVSQDRCLVTLISVNAQKTLDRNFIEAFVGNALQTDDVFCPAFLRGVLFYGASEYAFSREVRLALERFGNQWIHSASQSELDRTLLPGPYVLERGKLWKVSRLHADTATAFTVGLRSLLNRDLEILQLQGSDQTPAIAVPSRLNSHVDMPNAPLRGVRITVKDIFDIAGLRTGLGSRAYAELYEPATHTAPSIQKLLDAGAELVGMSRMCSMVLKAPPTQCVDVSSPFNPRGDGYQSPSGGSSGQAAAVATYSWLDFAIGSDSTFSGRMPAQANGCFSLRPTVHALSTEGMWSGVPQFDTPCVFGRDIKEFEKLVNVWYGSNLSCTNGDDLPLAILTPADAHNVGNDPQRQIFTQFVSDLESCLGTHAHQVSIPDLWDQEPPVGLEGIKLGEYLSEEVATRSYVYSFWKKIEGFFNDYEAMFQKTPFMPPPKGIHLWDPARSVTAEQHESALHKLSVYRGWLLKTYLQAHKRNVILVTSLGSVEPTYRDEWPNEKNLYQQLWEPLLVAPIVGGPELVVPAGHVSYNSRVSGRDEPLPVCVSLMGLPGQSSSSSASNVPFKTSLPAYFLTKREGSDLQLIDLATHFLEGTARPTCVHVGRDMFTPS